MKEQCWGDYLDGVPLVLLLVANRTFKWWADGYVAVYGPILMVSVSAYIRSEGKTSCPEGMVKGCLDGFGGLEVWEEGARGKLGEGDAAREVGLRVGAIRPQSSN